MDPFTAALIIGGISAGIGMMQSSSARKEQARLEREQRAARDRQVRTEIGAASQSALAALGTAQQRPTSSRASFKTATQEMGTSILGNLQPQNSGGSMSGTF